MAHLHDILDVESNPTSPNDPYFIIDSNSRAITCESEEPPILTQGDHNSEVFTFEMPRFIEGHDMSACDVFQIHYINLASGATSKRSSGVYEVKNLQISTEDENVVLFTWTISQNATLYVGSLNFAIRALCLNGSKIDYSWATTTYSGIPVSETIDNANTVVEQYADVLESWYMELLMAGTSSYQMLFGARDEALTEINTVGEEKIDELDRTAHSAIQTIHQTYTEALVELDRVGEEKIAGLRDETIENIGDEILDRFNIHSDGGEGYGSMISNDLETNQASGNYSNAIGLSTTASGVAAHTEGFTTGASGDYSHAEGNMTDATNEASHAEGYSTHADGRYSHTEGNNTTASGEAAHAEGFYTIASESYSHAEGYNSTTYGVYAHAEGTNANASGESSHAEGNGSYASGKYSHAEGSSSTATGEASHAEGEGSYASGKGSHAEGLRETNQGFIGAIGDYSHAEGHDSEAKGKCSHAEGHFTTASNEYSHAEGETTTASGVAAHAEGKYTTASGEAAHAEGYDTTASKTYSHAEGIGTETGASGQTVMGKYNAVDDDALVVIGNGNSADERSNAVAVYDNAVKSNVPIETAAYSHSYVTRYNDWPAPSAKNKIELSDTSGGLYIIHGWYNGNDAQIVRESMTLVYVPPYYEIQDAINHSTSRGDPWIGYIKFVGDQGGMYDIFAGIREGKIIVYVDDPLCTLVNLNCATKIGLVPIISSINRPTQPAG